MYRLHLYRFAFLLIHVAKAWVQQQPTRRQTVMHAQQQQSVAIVGAGWGGLAAAHRLSHNNSTHKVTVIEASPTMGGLVREGFSTRGGTRIAEAGQHGFWNNYHNIYRLLESEIDGIDGMDQLLTQYAEQGQYSPDGLQAIWPVYQNQPVDLPTGIAQLAYTRFLKLPLTDLLTAFPLVLAFSDFDDSKEAWERYDSMSFRDLCRRLGVSQRCYDEAFEPMILTGLFAPGEQCSAAAALGMAYFFVLQSQAAFDARWCRGNIGKLIFEPWVKSLKARGVEFRCNTKVTGFAIDSTSNTIQGLILNGNSTMKVDKVIFAVGANALCNFARFCPELTQYEEFQRFANLRGTSVLATRIFLDTDVRIPYTANACWGFDKGVGMTMFDIKAIHGLKDTEEKGSVIEVDYYHASSLLVQSDETILKKVKRDLDTILGPQCRQATVVDAAIVRLPNAVNWYFPGSYRSMPDHKSASLSNLYYCGDIVRTRHGSWSQEKAFVTGLEAANLMLGQNIDFNVLPAMADEPHVKMGKTVIGAFRDLQRRVLLSNPFRAM